MKSGFLTLSALAPVVILAAATPPSSGSTPQALTFWFEPHGLSPEQVEVVNAALARMADDLMGLAPASRPEETDVLLRLIVGAPSMTLEEGGPQIGAGGAGGGAAQAGAEPGIEVRDTSTPTTELTLSLVDIFEGAVVDEMTVTCDVPLTQGRFLSPCLRANLGRAIQRMDQWAAREVAAFDVAGDFGPSPADRRRLRPEELARAYYREAVRASRAGFEVLALNLMAEAQPLFKQTGLRREEGLAWEHLAYLMAVTAREQERVLDYAEQAVRIAREVSDDAAEARALTLLAACEARAGNYARARRVAASAGRRGREIGDPLVEGWAVAIQSGVMALQGSFEQARQLQAVAMELIRAGDNDSAEARFQLAMAAALAQVDERERAATLEQLEAAGDRARAIGDLALLRDVTFVEADVRYATTEFELVVAGEIDAIRAFKLARRLDDEVGQAAALGLLGAFAMRLGKSGAAVDYLVAAQEKARDAGFLEGATDSFQMLGETSADLERGLELLEAVGDARRELGDLGGLVKTLSDMSRLQSALERDEDAWGSYREAAAAAGEYARQLRNDPDLESIERSFTTVLKSLVATRTELPFLARYLRLNHMAPLPNPSWRER